MRGRIEAEVADLEHRRPLHRRTAGQRAQPRQQLPEVERLRQVVVGAGVEAGDAVVDGVASSQHQHGRPDAVASQAAADLEAVHSGQHHIEHDRVVRNGSRHPERFLPAIGDVGRVTLLAESAAQQLPELLLVLHHQDTHGSILACDVRAR